MFKNLNKFRLKKEKITLILTRNKIFWTKIFWLKFVKEAQCVAG
jgi:hypothetical protein